MPRPSKEISAGSRIYLGIDPGASGGLAEIGFSDRRQYCKSLPMPSTERDIWNWFEERMVGVEALGDSCYAIIEKVHAMPGNGVVGMFKFGQNYGFLRACLIAAGIPFEEVPPQSWPKVFGMKQAKQEPKTAWKQRLRAKAQQLFPSTEIKLPAADAVLLSEFCRRKCEGRS